MLTYLEENLSNVFENIHRWGIPLEYCWLLGLELIDG